MNYSRQSDTNSDARYGNGSYNINMNSLGGGVGAGGGGGSHYYSGVIPNLGTGGGANYGFGYPYNDKAYSIMTTEPVTIRKDQPLVIVDPIVEEHVKSYLFWSVLNIFFCGIIGGIFTTFMSFNVRKLNDRQDFKQARRLSGKVLLGNMIVTGIGSLIFLAAFPYVYMAIYPSLPKINW